MRPRFEFVLHLLDEGSEPSVDPTLALMGAQGWEIRGLTLAGSRIVVALQRPLDEDAPLPDAPTLAASLEEPLPAPTVAELAEAVRPAAADIPSGGTMAGRCETGDDRSSMGPRT
ncbi:MAG: hypothetical protein M3R44_00235 [Candidatus Eremiobacteraeota bacterium]|nr:hypothetical protein [Candidatus Eremiobacteraeota bacterium]